ncbi:hypothetical protein FRC01_002895 [Tulasnella sp. 417]|nr:hypothetical protein FRC01_002895 [Tulasnella sp. 417]
MGFGITLHSAQLSDIRFLHDFFEGLCGDDIFEDKRDDPAWKGLRTISSILYETLNRDGQQLAPTTSELDSDWEDETWTKDWEIKDLLEWMLLEARAVRLEEESHELRSLVQRLERRLIAISDTPSESCAAYPGSPEPVAEIIVRTSKLHHWSKPILLLPPELFRYIFEFICSPRSLALFFPLVLSHVNSDFRSIVLDMPSLWNTIDDNFSLPMANLYLERSKIAPLDIRIGSNGQLATKEGKLVQLFQYLKPHAQRVKALKVVAHDCQAIDDLEELLENSFPCVGFEKLEFGCCGHLHPHDHVLPFTLGEPDSLQELHLWGYTLDEWTHSFPTALRRLQLSNVSASFDEVLATVECAPALSVLVLEDCLLLEFENAKTVVTAGSLIELRFIRIYLEDAVLLASVMHTPALATLAVIGPWRTINLNFLVDLMKASKEIRSVEICDYNLAGNDWLAIFKHLPNLTHLRIRASHSSNEDLQVLTMAQTLPNLTSITLDNELRLTTLLVEQMARAHPKLESIVLRGWDPSNVSTESLATISKLVKNIFVETFRRSPEESPDEESERDSSDESSSGGSWLSGDEYVAMKGRTQLHGN